MCTKWCTEKSNMSDVERYIEAATRDNTRRSYQAAIEHFEVDWGDAAHHIRASGPLSCSLCQYAFT